MANAMKKEAVIILGELNKFSSYLPYSGKYQEASGNNIFQFNGKLDKLTSNDVFPFIEKKLVNLVWRVWTSEFHFSAWYQLLYAR